MKLIVGLGNTGDKYINTRHNVGFMAVDALAAEHRASFKDQPKFKAMTAKVTIDGEEVLLAKPTTMMNNSGQAVQLLANFYKIEDADVTLIYDDLDIAYGSVKKTWASSPRGHNGVLSVAQHFSQDCWHIRIGIDVQPRPIAEPSDFVLARFRAEEENSLESITSTARQLIFRTPNKS